MIEKKCGIALRYLLAPPNDEIKMSVIIRTQGLSVRLNDMFKAAGLEVTSQAGDFVEGKVAYDGLMALLTLPDVLSVQLADTLKGALG